LFTHEGVKPLEYFSHPTAQEDSSLGFSQVYFRLTTSEKTLTQFIVLFHVFKFSAASFNSVTSSMVTVLNLDAILTLIEMQAMLP